jgi:YVTN family beta-propeller protein
VLSPDGRWLYATLNGAGRVVKIDTRSGGIATSVATGTEPRSMAISTDGQSLYVVNYESSSVSKLRASDLSVLQTVATAQHPIGITYDARTGDVWVACYVGVIEVFHDR